MHLQSNAHQRTHEYRRYFPDWTHRSLPVGERLEIDHNSYFAGGYAEEFGYLAHSESWRGAALIDAAPPDDDALPLVQWAGIHPGYPLRPYPISVDHENAVSRSTVPSSLSGTPGGESEPGHRGRFVRVTERRYEREHRSLARRLFAAVMRFPG